MPKPPTFCPRLSLPVLSTIPQPPPRAPSNLAWPHFHRRQRSWMRTLQASNARRSVSSVMSFRHRTESYLFQRLCKSGATPIRAQYVFHNSFLLHTVLNLMQTIILLRWMKLMFTKSGGTRWASLRDFEDLGRLLDQLELQEQRAVQSLQVWDPRGCLPSHHTKPFHPTRPPWCPWTRATIWRICLLLKTEPGCLEGISMEWCYQCIH